MKTKVYVGMDAQGHGDDRGAAQGPREATLWGGWWARTHTSVVPRPGRVRSGPRPHQRDREPQAGVKGTRNFVSRKHLSRRVNMGT